MIYDSSTIFNIKLIFFAVSPIILAILAASFWAIVCAIRRNFSLLRENTICTTLVILNLFHPSLARVFFAPFSCIDVLGEQRLREDINTVCYEGTHLLNLILVAVPSIIVWIFLVPAIILIILYKNRTPISQLDRLSTLSKSDHQTIIDLRAKYGFFFIGYKEKLFFWEILTIYRKVILVILTQFLVTVSAET